MALVLQRKPEAEAEEQAILQQASVIETRRKQEAAAQRAAGELSSCCLLLFNKTFHPTAHPKAEAEEQAILQQASVIETRRKQEVLHCELQVSRRAQQVSLITIGLAYHPQALKTWRHAQRCGPSCSVIETRRKQEAAAQRAADELSSCCSLLSSIASNFTVKAEARMRGAGHLAADQRDWLEADP